MKQMTATNTFLRWIYQTSITKIVCLSVSTWYEALVLEEGPKQLLLQPPQIRFSGGYIEYQLQKSSV